MKEYHYQTIVHDTESLFKSKGSKFHGYAFPVYEKAAIQEKLHILQQQHPKARHICYAYKLGIDNNSFRINDDGEPSGSAGKPIYSQILSLELTNVLVAVVRYFGGTLLGVPGLIHAYKSAAREALEAAPIIEKEVKNYYSIEFEYQYMGNLMQLLKNEGLEIIAQQHSEIGSLQITLPVNKTENIIRNLKAGLLEEYPENITKKTTVDGINFSFLEQK